VDTNGQEKTVGVCGPDQVFGEEAILTGEARMNTATTVTDAELLVLLKEGFDRYLAHDLKAMQAVMGAVDAQQVQVHRPSAAQASAPSMQAAGKVVVVYSPKGGAGKSTLAVNLASLLARDRPGSTALLDLALTFGHDALLLGVAPRYPLAKVPVGRLLEIDPQQIVERHAVQHASSLQLIVGAARPEDGDLVTSELVSTALELLRRQFAFVVVDTPSNFADTTLAALEAADRVLVVVTPEITALRDLNECQRILQNILHIPEERLRFVLNRTFPYQLMEQHEIQSSIRLEIAAELPYSGEPAGRAALGGEPLVLSQPAAPFSQVVAHLASSLISTPLPSSAVASGNGTDASASANAKAKGRILGWLLGRGP
jgi:pilus assembly protein CpaE